MNEVQTKWEFEAEHIMGCNCDYGCPCNFNALPTYGSCEAIIAYRIIEGFFGDTKLDGVCFGLGAWWPKAIHEGNGILTYYVDDKADEAQFTAIAAITSGKFGGGMIEVFANMAATINPVKRTKIEFHYDDYDSWFTMEGVGEARSEHIISHDKKFEGSIKLPNGIGWKEALVTNIKKWWYDDNGIKLKHENRHGHVAKMKANNSGCIA